MTPKQLERQKRLRKKYHLRRDNAPGGRAWFKNLQPRFDFGGHKISKTQIWKEETQVSRAGVAYIRYKPVLIDKT